MAFANAEELYKVYKLTIEKVQQDKELVNKLANANLVTGMQISNLDAYITIICKDGQVVAEYGPPTQKIDVTTIQNDDTFYKFWQGKVNLMMAMAKGQVKARGAVTSILKLLPRITPCYALFVQSLRELGREDLIL